MNIREIVDKLAGIMQNLTALYAELSQELPENYLRVVVDNTREFSELKKMAEMPKFLHFRHHITPPRPQRI